MTIPPTILEMSKIYYKLNRVELWGFMTRRNLLPSHLLEFGKPYGDWCILFSGLVIDRRHLCVF